MCWLKLEQPNVLQVSLICVCVFIIIHFGNMVGNDKRAMAKDQYGWNKVGNMVGNSIRNIVRIIQSSSTST